MVFGPNDSPLAGRAGKAVTGRVIGERLVAEAETSVSLKVNALPGIFVVYKSASIFVPAFTCKDQMLNGTITRV